MHHRIAYYFLLPMLILSAFSVSILGVYAATGPTIAPHDDVVAEATSASGATVLYDVPSVDDPVDGPGTATCLLASGSVFPFGTTAVTCDYTNSNAETAPQTTFNVLVHDTTPPLVNSHADFTKVATGPLTPVSYGTPNAFDPKDFRIEGTRPSDCTPENGSLFPIGTTPVSCTAVDSAGNEAIPTVFNVIVTLPDVVPDDFCGTGAHFDTELQTCIEDAPPVVDVCANIDGIQETPPSGTTLEGDQCVATSTGGGGGGSSRRNGGTVPQGEVLGASTDESNNQQHACTFFTMDLTLGSTGSEVPTLQQFLIGKGYAIPAGATGYFGLQTKSALAAYQTANSITPATGYFGPLTRAKINASCSLSENTGGQLEQLQAQLLALQLQLASLSY